MIELTLALAGEAIYRAHFVITLRYVRIFLECAYLYGM